MKKTCFSLSLTVFAFAVAAAWADDPVEKAVEYRQGVMTVFAWNVTSMGAMVKEKVPFDAPAFQGHAKDLAAAVQLNLLAGFPDDSVSEDSDAKDEIWLAWDDFEQKFGVLKEQSARLAEVAAGGDEAAMKEQFGKTAKTCKGCHDDYKN